MRQPPHLWVPRPALSRPAFWPWSAGQAVGIPPAHPWTFDDEWFLVQADSLLFVWHMLAPSRPTGPWDPRELFATLGASSIDDPALSSVLRYLRRRQLAAFDPRWAAWVKRAPSDNTAGWAHPDPRLWPKHLSMRLAEAWWHLQPFRECASWSWDQARFLCPALTDTALADLQAEKKAVGFLRS